MSVRLTRPFPVPVAKGFAVPLARPASLSAQVALVAVNLASVTFFLLSYTPHGVGFGPDRIDLDVYRAGGPIWLSGGDLSARLPPQRDGVTPPFPYPPSAAALLAP